LKKFLNKQSITLIITIFIALSGGIPGIISVVSYFESKPNLMIDICGFGTAKIASDPDNSRVLFIVLIALANSGAKPVFPAGFGMEYKYNDEWIKLNKEILPENFSSSNNNSIFCINNPPKYDLQRYDKAIDNSKPIYGLLAFTTNNFTLSELRSKGSLEVRITCFDVFRDKYETYKTMYFNADVPEFMIFPKHGLSIKPKK